MKKLLTTLAPAASLALASCGSQEQAPAPTPVETNQAPAVSNPVCDNASITPMPMASGVLRYSANQDSFQILVRDGSVRLGTSQGGSLSDLYNELRRAEDKSNNVEVVFSDFSKRCPSVDTSIFRAKYALSKVD